jgi:ribosomal protein L11 methyltransferase
LPFVATVLLSGEQARAFSATIELDERLAGLPFDFSERSDGRCEVSTYFVEAPDAEALAALAAALETLGSSHAALAVSSLPDTDWVTKSLSALAPVRARRFLVHGGHDRSRVLPNDIAIEIEAGLAFGTGHHGSTAGCLIAIDRLARSRPVRNALDLGTGSAVLAIAIAKRTQARVVASDIDPVAVTVARENVRLNGVGWLVTTVVADGLRARAIRERAPYDLIVANILAGPLMAFASAIRRSLTPGGTVILSGLLQGQQRRVAAVYRALGLRRIGAIAIDEWLTLVMKR